jgi:hypothetical protein
MKNGLRKMVDLSLDPATSEQIDGILMEVASRFVDQYP